MLETGGIFFEFGERGREGRRIEVRLDQNIAQLNLDAFDEEFSV